MSRPRLLTRNWLFVLTTLVPFPYCLAAAQHCSQDPQCRRHLDQAVALEAEQKHAPALREFQAAYQQQKDPRLALNIGRTLHKLGRFAEALSWYKDVGRAAPADIELQKQLQEFTAQARQNLPVTPAPRPSRFIINQQLTSSPINLNWSWSNSNNQINSNNHVNNIHNHFAIERLQPEPKPLYRRASLWGPLVGLTLAAGVAGIASAAWPRPWRPDPQIPISDFYAITAGGVK